MSNNNFLDIDWPTLPVPINDANLEHLNNFIIPSVVLRSTN